MQKELGDWTSKTAYVRVPQPVYDVPPADFRIEVKDKQNAVISGRLQVPLREDEREYQALRLAAQIFGGSGGASGRLWDRVRDKDGLSYGVGGSLSGGQFNRHADWSLYAIAAPQNVAGVRAAFARRDGAGSPGRLQRRRARARQGGDRRLVAAGAGAGRDAGDARSTASSSDAKTPLYFAELDALRAQITLDEVNAAFRKYVVPEKMVFGVAGDFSNVAARRRRRPRPRASRRRRRDDGTGPEQSCGRSRRSGSAARTSWSKRARPSCSTWSTFASRRAPSRCASKAASSPTSTAASTCRPSSTGCRANSSTATTSSSSVRSTAPTYDPRNGRCAGGPCGQGKLTRIDAEERDGLVYWQPTRDTRGRRIRPAAAAPPVRSRVEPVGTPARRRVHRAIQIGAARPPRWCAGSHGPTGATAVRTGAASELAAADADIGIGLADSALRWRIVVRRHLIRNTPGRSSL